MFSLIIALLLFPIVFVSCVRIPFIQNVTLIPRYQWNSTTVINQTCEQCLCIAIPSFVAFNCFPNNTCQLFYTFPITYKIQSTPQVRLYFPQRIFPNISQCCMPNLAYLLDKLRNGTWTYVNVSSPRNLQMDNNGYLVTVEMQPAKLDRFNAQTLTLVNQIQIAGSYAMTVEFENNAYFVGLMSGPIIVIDSGNLTVIKSITSTYITNLRSIMFLENGRMMVITNSNNNGTIVFFYQTNNVSLNYTFAYQKLTSYPQVNGLTAHNDSYFYATSYTNNSIYSYTAVVIGTSWIETLVIDANVIRNISGGDFMTVDECGRYWFSLETSAVYIFDNLGSSIGNFSLGSGIIMDTLISDNYVMYFSDHSSNWSRIIRIDPHIQC